MTKDEGLIERLILVSGIKDGLVVNSSEALEKFIARYLAERGGEADFWTRQIPGESREFCEEPFTTDWRPLFITPQPAIPEGMALVPIAPNSEMLLAGFSAWTKGDSTRVLSAMYKAMIAAAGVKP